MNIADISLAIGMGLAAGVVIAGILIITWFLCVNYPRRTKRSTIVRPMFPEINQST